MKRENSIAIKVIMLVLAMFVICFVSCEKKDLKPSNSSSGNITGTSSGSLSDEDSLQYLMYRIMQVDFINDGRDSSYDLPTYYWYSQVPSLNPLSSAYPNSDTLLSVIKSYPVNPQTNQPIDRYSFLDRTGQVSKEYENGIVDDNFSGLAPQGDYGMQVSYAEDSLGNTDLYVLYTDKNSPAGQKGIQRGWEITAVNGNTNVSYDGPNGANVTMVSNALFSSTSVTLTFKELNGISVTYTLNSTPYDVDPILFDTIYNVGDKKVGYFVFYAFTSIYNDSGTATYTKQALDQEFDKLTSAGINDLIVDLRYNGGGDITTAEYLDSALAPAPANGKVMYKYLYNDKLSQNMNQLGLSSTVNFAGTGDLHLDHLFFIVSRSTASASELTMNNLKPYMDVKLVGDTTYGKPVGFIDFNISDYHSGQPHYLADLYAIDFATENANNQGGYYEGIVPDVEASDYINVPWGNPDDENVSDIFNYITTGSFARSYTYTREVIPHPASYRVRLRGAIPLKTFNGMIDYTLSKKINRLMGDMTVRH